MRTPREILLEMWWREDRDFKKVDIHYVHRGVPGDMKVINGKDVRKLNKYYFEAFTTLCIPYHRIRKIVYDGEVIFDRKKRG